MLIDSANKLWKWLWSKLNRGRLAEVEKRCQPEWVELDRKGCLSKEELDSVLSQGSHSGFWRALSQYINVASDTNKLMAISLEGGNVESKYMYMRGYINAQRDILRRVELAVRNEALKEARKTTKEKVNG